MLVVLAQKDPLKSSSQTTVLSSVRNAE